MKLEYIEPFVTTTRTVLAEVLHTDFAQGDLSLRRGHELAGEVSVVIGLRDQSGESVILNMDAETARNICAAMNGSPGAGTLLDMDALGELGNMVAGNAMSALSAQGFDFTMHPPMAANHEDLPRVTEGLEVLQVPMTSEHGLLTVNFTIRTN
jgi:chemotaxis protein CheX